VVHSKRKKERKGAGCLLLLGVCVCVWVGAVCVPKRERERERERVECFGLGISFERNAPLSSSPYQINSMKLKCPNIPYNFVRESLVEGRCYVVVVFQWRIIWCYRYRYHPFLPYLSMVAMRLGRHLRAGRRCPTSAPSSSLS
jgi:hypothetical protein